MFDFLRREAKASPARRLVARLPLGPEEVGAPLDLRAGSGGTQMLYEALGRRPLAPCGLRARREDGGITLRWTRRGRLAAEAWALADIPLDEAVERYHLELLDGEAVLRAVELDAPRFHLDAALTAGLYGGVPASLRARVRQLSPTAGPGPALDRVLSP